MKKPIVKALACAMALTMALSSPISALATEGISTIFSTGNSDDPKKSATSSVTNTDTGVIDVEDTKEKEYKEVVGIEIDPSSVTLSTAKAGKEKVKFTPTIIFDSDAFGTEAFSLAEMSEMSDQIFVLDGIEYYASELQKKLYENVTWVYGKWDENTKEFDKTSADQSKNRVKLAFERMVQLL